MLIVTIKRSEKPPFCRLQVCVATTLVHLSLHILVLPVLFLSLKKNYRHSQFHHEDQSNCRCDVGSTNRIAALMQLRDGPIRASECRIRHQNTPSAVQTLSSSVTRLTTRAATWHISSFIKLTKRRWLVCVLIFAVISTWQVSVLQIVVCSSYVDITLALMITLACRLD